MPCSSRVTYWLGWVEDFPIKSSGMVGKGMADWVGGNLTLIRPARFTNRQF